MKQGATADHLPLPLFLFGAMDAPDQLHDRRMIHQALGRYLLVPRADDDIQHCILIRVAIEIVSILAVVLSFALIEYVMTR